MSIQSNKPVPIVILGGGYAFHEIFELIEDINADGAKYGVVAVLDDNPELKTQDYNGVPFKGPLEEWINFPDDVKFILAIGSYNTRMTRWSIVQRLSIPNNRFETIIHPSAKVYRDATLSPGCIVHYGSLINSKAIVGPHVLVSAMSMIGVENLIGEGALIASGVVTTTTVNIGSYSFVGAGAVIGPSIEIGEGSMVSAGAVVLRNVPPGESVLGNPARSFQREDVSSDLHDLWQNTKILHAMP
jgi:sugar O-acyltransferase (sialic acid O-acetyltransferase NeuD family)